VLFGLVFILGLFLWSARDGRLLAALAQDIYVPVVVREPTPTPPPTPTPSPTPPGPEWLAYVNDYRAMAALPPVTENPDWSYGNWLHGRYVVKNDLLTHSEDPSNPWYSAEGSAAGESSNLAGHSAVDPSDEWAIDTWMQSPFHAVGMLDPQLLQAGYGSYREADGGLQMAAGLDVLRGLGALAPGVSFPVKWPSDGTAVPLTSHWSAYPSPLTSCPGYTTPSGLPIILQLGAGELAPDVTGSSFRQGGTPLDHCVFSELTYTNPDPGQQSLGRNILAARDAVVLVPRDPLIPGAGYTASITADGQTHSWSFTVSGSAGAGLPGAQVSLGSW
jgi:uncharacterized protein YkwD